MDEEKRRGRSRKKKITPPLLNFWIRHCVRLMMVGGVAAPLLLAAKKRAKFPSATAQVGCSSSLRVFA
jgi:hypothetical protein